MMFSSAYLSDKGLLRQNNEDVCYALDVYSNHGSSSIDYGLYLVADGMGGHQAGEVASRTAVDLIIKIINEIMLNSSTINNYSQLLVNAITQANNAVYSLAQNNTELAGMGTTVTVGLRIYDHLYIGHAGDSRAYLFRNKESIRLTNDHSLVANLIKAGMITEEEARTHPDRNKIYRSLGTSSDISIDTYKNIANNDSLSLISGDILLFCTDGLHGLIDDKAIQTVVAGNTDLHQGCKQLIAEANLLGGVDNISVVLVKSE
jgi:protein phosphatase